LEFSDFISRKAQNTLTNKGKTYEKTINTDRNRQYQHGSGTIIRIRSDCRQRE